MSERSKADLFRLVFSFCLTHWRRQPRLIALMIVLMTISAASEAVTPMLLGRLIDAVTAGDRSAAVQTAVLVLCSISCASPISAC